VEAEFKLKRRYEDVDPVADGRDRRMSMANDSQAITQLTPVKVGNDEQQSQARKAEDRG